MNRGTIDSIDPRVYKMNRLDKEVEQVFLSPDFYNFSDTTVRKQLNDWFNRLKDITVSHIEHNSTAQGDNHNTFTTNPNYLKLNFDCFTLGMTGSGAQHSIDVPIANSTQAGIITAESGAFFDENTTGKVDTLGTLKNFLDGVEENTTELEDIIFNLNLNRTNFTKSGTVVTSNAKISSDASDKINNGAIITLKGTITNSLKCYYKFGSGTGDLVLLNTSGVDEFHFQKASGQFKLIDKFLSHTVDLYSFGDYPSMFESFYIGPNYTVNFGKGMTGSGSDGILDSDATIILSLSETKVTPLETRLDEKLGKTVYNTTDANNILKGLVLHSDSDLSIGPCLITVPFNIGSSIQATDANILSMLEGVWIIDNTGAIFEVIDDNSAIVLRKVTDHSVSEEYSFGDFPNPNQINLVHAL